MPTSQEASVAPAVPQQSSARPSPQPQPTVQQPMPVQQPMAPMPFYADPNRFPTPVWQTEATQGWPQGQFIQQISPLAQPIDTYQQYPNGIYQTTYQQPSFETNTFYTGAVQVLTNARPPSVPNQQPQMVPSRPNSNFAHTPSPSPAQQSQTPQNNRQYQEYSQFNANSESQSRPSSANQNPPTPNQNFNQQQQQKSNSFVVSSSNFSPNSNSTQQQQQQQQYVNANSGNGQPGYPQVNTSSPQVVSHNSNGYPGSEYSGQWQQQEQQQQQELWEEQSNEYLHNSEAQQQQQATSKTFSKADKVNLNTRIKTMILNKQEGKMDDVKSVEENTTGHFLWYSHHHHLSDDVSVDGGPQRRKQTRNTEEHQTTTDACGCTGQRAFREPGAFYTHLGCADSLMTLRRELEGRTGMVGAAIRIEKVRYTGKEGKTAEGCPVAKWIIRRSNDDEKYLVVVKHRQGHFCSSSFIIVCIVVWEGVASGTADCLYTYLTETLNKHGLPTKRRCATNEPKTCACQGVDEATCGASYTFGCSWSMYYNGCKFTRSKEVRKYRLAAKSEEKQLEEHCEGLADRLSAMYRRLAPQSFTNQCRFEQAASACRLGSVEGRPFSGVTACLDFCAHAHKDLQNMIDGCTVVVTLTKHRGRSRPEQEQLHVLPMYVPDDSDEYGSRENQRRKVVNGHIDVLHKYPSEVRTLSTPPTCARRKNKNATSQKEKRRNASWPPSQLASERPEEIQNGHVSSTVGDSPLKNGPRYGHDQNNHFSYGYGSELCGNGSLPQFSVFRFPFDDFACPLPDAVGKNAIDIKLTDNRECFDDPDIGGVAIALQHGSVLFECAKREMHATTALKTPNRQSPTRISLVFYQHRNLNKPQHGLGEYTSKMKQKLDSSRSQSTGFVDFPRVVDGGAPTLPTPTLTTMFPMYPCMVTGPYQEYLPNS